MNASPRIVCVHGSGPKPEPERYLDLWRRALHRGIERERPDALTAFEAAHVELVCFADLLPNREPDGANAQTDLDDREECLNALASLSKPKQFRRSAYESLPGKSPLREFAADVASPLLRASGLSRQVIGRVVPEFRAYWQDEGSFATRLRERLIEALISAMATDGPVILIAHGFGNVPCWDTLWQLSRQSDTRGSVSLWLSLGSPLADDTVRSNLAGRDESGNRRFPDNIQRWHNVAAEDDFFCHDETVGNDFAAYADSDLISEVADYRIYNLAKRNGRSDPHHSTGYLIHPRCARSLADALSGSVE